MRSELSHWIDLDYTGLGYYQIQELGYGHTSRYISFDYVVWC